jgi:hypothetical protein
MLTSKAAGSGVRIPAEVRDSSLLYNVQTSSGVHLAPRLLFSRCWGPHPGVKRPRPDVDHCTSASVEVKNVWSYTSVSRIYLLGKNRHNFTSCISCLVWVIKAVRTRRLVKTGGTLASFNKNFVYRFCVVKVEK